MTIRPVLMTVAFLGAVAVHAALFFQFDAPEEQSAAPEQNEGILVALGEPDQPEAGVEEEVAPNTAAESIPETAAPEVATPQATAPETAAPETATVEPDQPENPELSPEGSAEIQTDNAPPEASSIEILQGTNSDRIEDGETDQPETDTPQSADTEPDIFGLPIATTFAAVPTPEFRPEPTPVPEPAQAARSSEDDRAEQVDYLSRLHGQLVGSKQYPASARDEGIEGVVQIGITINREGRVTFFRITDSSGHEALDEEVRQMVVRAQPLPQMPASMDRSEISINIAIRFKIE